MIGVTGLLILLAFGAGTHSSGGSTVRMPLTLSQIQGKQFNPGNMKGNLGLYSFYAPGFKAPVGLKEIQKRAKAQKSK